MASRRKELVSISEESLLENIVKKFISSKMPGEYLEYPDDVKDLILGGPKIIVNVDGTSIGSVKLPWRSYRDVGWTIIVGAISDHVVKGSFPRDVFVSIGLSKKNAPEILRELYLGINDAIKHYNLRLLGGDLNSSNDPWVSVAVIGYTSAKKPPRRDTAKPGDRIIVTNIYGAMGYVVYNKLIQNPPEWVVKATRRPIVYIETAAIIASNYRSIHASIDVSDGLGYALYEISRRSGYGIELYEKPIYYQELEEHCSSEKCLWEYILNGGEEYGAVICVDKGQVDEIIDFFKKFNIPHREIGIILDTYPKVTIRDIGKVKLMRWDQFGGWIEIK